MTIDEAIEMYTSNAEYERTHGSLQGCMDFKQLAEWLKELKQLREQRRWISVSEDLPKDAYGCIVTVMDVDLKTQNEFENVLPYFVGYDGETWNNAGGEPIPYEVIAWMKAPEPYKEEGGER